MCVLKNQIQLCGSEAPQCVLTVAWQKEAFWPLIMAKCTQMRQAICLLLLLCYKLNLPCALWRRCLDAAVYNGTALFSLCLQLGFNRHKSFTFQSVLLEILVLETSVYSRDLVQSCGFSEYKVMLLKQCVKIYHTHYCQNIHFA